LQDDGPIFSIGFMISMFAMQTGPVSEMQKPKVAFYQRNGEKFHA
jgi:hypothetical protein